MARSQDLLDALVGAQGPAGLGRPQGPEIAGVTTGPGGKTWDAVASADCADLPGDSVTFFVLDDGTIIVSTDLPDGSLIPLADVLEATVSPPYRAAATKTDGTLWTAAAESVRTVPLPGLDGAEVQLSVVGGQRELTIDGEVGNDAIEPLDTLAGEHGDVSIHAERVDGELFAVDVFPL